MSIARSRSRGARSAALLLALGLVLTACGGATDDDGDPSADGSDDGAEATDGTDDAEVDDTRLGVAIASYDHAVGSDERLMAGLFSQDQQLLVHGEVTFQLGYLGEEQAGEADLREPLEASFLPVPGMEPPGSADAPVLTGQADANGSGVYTAEVAFDQPGYWGLRVVAELEDGTQMEGSSTFAVHPEHGAPRIGDEAPRSVNWTVDDVESGAIEPTALDSRAREGNIPDPQMHATTVADAIDEGRPSIVILSTPVFCVSRFCGPLVEELSALSQEYGDRAEFIHIEIWEDFEDSVLNEAAEPWIQTNEGDREPWVYVVDGDGTIAARWDNVIDRAELVEALDALPAA